MSAIASRDVNDNIDAKRRWPGTPTRSAVSLDGRRLSYLDYGGNGRPLLALHGHFGEARAFARLAAALAHGWRVIALDQRGHGESERAADYSRVGYVADALAVLDALELGRVAMLGHSLGGVNAYQLAAAHPDRVGALVIEDIGAVIDDDLSFTLTWPRRAATRDALVAGLGPIAPYLVDAVRSFPDGWGLAFDAHDMVRSQQELNGDHWADWLATDCPALLLRGANSTVLSAEHARDMVAGRPWAVLLELPAGHVIHDDAPAEFAAAVGSFLDGLPPSRVGA